MKKFFLFSTLFVLSGVLTSNAFAHEPRVRVDYTIEVLVDGDVALKEVPVGIASGVTASLSPSSVADAKEVVFKVKAFPNGDNLEFEGEMVTKIDGEVVSAEPFRTGVTECSGSSIVFNQSGQQYVLKLAKHKNS